MSANAKKRTELVTSNLEIAHDENVHPIDDTALTREFPGS